MNLNTWLSRGDILIKLGESEAAIYNFNKLLNFIQKMLKLNID